MIYNYVLCPFIKRRTGSYPGPQCTWVTVTRTTAPDFWKTFGDSLPTGANAGVVLFSNDGSAYVYLYSQVLSQAYVVKGLK
jgi:hypothetical protein